jgi:hypothetical protein
MITLFHVTTVDNAAAILRDGFVNGRGEYMTSIELRGVFLSDRPLEDEGKITDPIVLAVTFDLLPSELADFELVEEGKPYREWCIPAELIRTKATVAMG